MWQLVCARLNAQACHKYMDPNELSDKLMTFPMLLFFFFFLFVFCFKKNGRMELYFNAIMTNVQCWSIIKYKSFKSIIKCPSKSYNYHVYSPQSLLSSVHSHASCLMLSNWIDVIQQQLNVALIWPNTIVYGYGCIHIHMCVCVCVCAVCRCICVTLNWL